MAGRPRKNTELQVATALENLPVFEDFKPLLSDKAKKTVEIKERELADATKTVQAIERRIALLEKEIARKVGKEETEIKELKKIRSLGKKNITGRLTEIWTIVEFDTSEIPGENEYEKKQFMSAQRRELAK